MKAILFTGFFAFLQCCALAQENKIVRFNQVNDDKQGFLKVTYQYPEFTMGKVVTKDGKMVQVNLNYNYLENKIFFIDAKGDTMEPVNPENFRQFIIQTDTFYFTGKEYVQQATHFSSNNLFLKRRLKHSGEEKKGAYGSYSGTTSITSQSTYTDGAKTTYLQTDINELYVFDDVYFVKDKFNKFYSATKKGIYDVFWKYEKQLKTFVEANKIDFAKKADLEKLLEYLRTLE